jgi:hypothetical protein
VVRLLRRRFIGSPSTYALLKNVNADPDPALSPTVPLSVYVLPVLALLTVLTSLPWPLWAEEAQEGASWSHRALPSHTCAVFRIFYRFCMFQMKFALITPALVTGT